MEDGQVKTDHPTIENEDDKEEKKKNLDNVPFRKRVSSFRTFLTYFYVEQKENPFQSLIGPGPENTASFWLTHLWYIFILSFIPVCSLLSTVGFIQPYLASDTTLCDWKTHRQSCQTVIIVFITYRIGFSITLFFLFTALLLSKRKSQDIKKDGFSTLHTGFWIEKVIVVLVLSCVTFAFPPVVFDVVWMYLVLLGDVILTCVMLFLTCDFAAYLNQKASHLITKKKWQCENAALELMQCCIGLFATIGLLLVSVYTVESMEYNRLITGYLTLMTIYQTGLLIYVRFQRKAELFCSLHATAFINFVVWICIKNYKQYTEPSHQEAGAWVPSNTIMLILMYILIIYAVVRSDHRQHFYYFYWTVCSGGNIERGLDQSKFMQRNKKEASNLNETLIECSHENYESIEDKETDSTEYDAVYNESFIHLFFCLVSLKSTAVVTNYTLLTDDHEDLKANKTFHFVISLFVSSLLVVILFTGYLIRSGADNNSDPLSVGLLLKSILQGSSHSVSKLLFGKPKCLSRLSLSRFVYLVFFMLCFGLACLVISPSFKHYFQRISLFCDHVTSFGACMSHDPTFISLYRIFATISIFHTLLGIATLDMNPMRRLRNEIQNGCWPIKMLVIFAIFACVVSLPSKVSRYWLYLDLVATFVFTLLQLFCLIDAITLVTYSCKSDTKSEINASSMSVACLLYVISIIAYVSFYIFYAHNYQCTVTRFFVSINLVLCLSASIISLHPDVQTGGLLLSAVVTSYCMYGTWSALNYNPEEKCNPLAHTLMLVEARPGRDAVSITDLFFLFVSLTYFIIRIKDVCRKTYDLSLRLLVEEIFRKKKNEDAGLALDKTDGSERIRKWLSDCEKSTPTDNSQGTVNTTSPNDETKPEKLDDTKQNTPQTMKNVKSDRDYEDDENYSYTSLHFICSMASSYAFLLLAHWLEPIPSSGFKVNLHWTMMSVKLISSSVSVFIYIWILVLSFFKSKLSRPKL